MKKVFQIKTLIAFLSLFIISCNETKIIEPIESSIKKEVISGELTIDMAKKWFSTNINSKAKIRTNTSKKPLWDYATQFTEKNGISFVIAPVLVEEKDQRFAVILKGENVEQQKINLENKKYREQGFSTPQKLLMFIDKNGNIQTILLKVVANIEYFENSFKKDKKKHAKIDIKDLDGMIMFFDWDDTKIIEAHHYEKGKLKGISESKNIKKNAKIYGCTTSTYQESVPCPTLKTSSQSCYISYDVMSCDNGAIGNSFSWFTPAMNVGGGGGGMFLDELSASYRTNTVDSFISQAAQNGVTFNPDERLEFIDNFFDFLKIRNILLKAIQKVGNKSIQWLEDNFSLDIPSLKTQERNLLSGNGSFGYKINLLLYYFNGSEAKTIAGSTMNALGMQGWIGNSCSACRGNAIKHSAFNILNAQTFGRQLAKSLGDAHEIGESNQGESIVDLHNNSIGLQLFDIYGPGGIFNLKDVLVYGMPNNSSNGFKFIKNNQVFWTKDYPNEN